MTEYLTSMLSYIKTDFGGRARWGTTFGAYPDKDDNGHGTIVYGLEWVQHQTRITGRSSVVNLSIGARKLYEPLDTAVINVAAGNEAMDAKYYSPARVSEAITVAALNITDQQTWWSNYGPAVDIFAGGENIVSTQTNSTTATTINSGTSLSTAYVTGLVAMFLTTGPLTPADLKKALNQFALHNILLNLKKYLS
ncbi:hypothetical protein C0995_004191 [Termitomyces sp. Mi166|nr:hypothetical protein C0995_004191 [Termitomyces sp. Mi166\